MNDSTGSISTALPRLKKGDSEALQQIWDQFFEPLKRVAQERVNPQHRKVRDEEDLALSAINAFHECVKNGRYETVSNRNDIWLLLVKIVERKAIDHIRRQQALKRGAGAVRGDSFATGLNQLVEKQSQHELEVEFVEHLNATLAKLNDPILLQVVKAKLEGHKNNEISEKIGRSISSVERKLRLARTIFEEEYYVS